MIMACSNPETSNGTSHADLLARISALELENQLLRESIEKQQQSASRESKIYFDGFCSRLDTNDNVSIGSASAADIPESCSPGSHKNDGIHFSLGESNRFSLQRDMNDMSMEDLDESNTGLNTDRIANSTRPLAAPEQSQLKDGTSSCAVELQRTWSNVLNKTLTRKSVKSFDSSSRVKIRCFEEFYLLSVDLGAEREQFDWVDSGTRYLDPFILRSADCLDRYPADSIGGISTDELSMFSLLGGLRMRIVPNVVKKMAWENELDYNVLVFTDGDGMSNHGVAVTAWNEIDASRAEFKDFVRAVKIQRKRRSAGKYIAGWLENVHKVNAENTKDNSNYEPGKVKRFFKTSMNKNAKSSKDPRINQSLRSKLKRTVIHLGPGHKESLEPYPDSVIKRAQESYNFMQKAADMGERVMVQRCYIMMGGDQSEQFLQFRSLQHLISMEVKGAGGSDANRHKFLDAVQAKIHLNPIEARVTHPTNDLEIVTSVTPTFDINIPEFNFVDKASIPLPLPQISLHWGLSTLFQRIAPSSFLALLRLLLIERSVLIIGESSIVVSSCACALLDLLRPYRWASTFMPLIPENMLDFVQSPVPFITGLAAQDKTNALRIVSDHRVIDAMNHGLNVVNLISGSVSITTEAGIKSMIQKSPGETTATLTLYRNRLKTLRGASSNSFPTFMEQGVSVKEVVTITAVQRIVQNYLKSFAGDIGSTIDGWQRYGIHMGGEDDEDMGDFAFYPKLFIQPLRKEIESQLQFQEMMAHSQLFIEYVSSKRQISMRRRNMARGEIGQFIARWIYDRWEHKQKQR